MSSYNKTIWKDSSDTEITATRLNNMEEGIEQAHNGENIPVFESYDNENDYESLFNLPTISAGDKLKDILSKITKFCNNFRYLFNFVKPTDIINAGWMIAWQLLLLAESHNL